MKLKPLTPRIVFFYFASSIMFVLGIVVGLSIAGVIHIVREEFWRSIWFQIPAALVVGSWLGGIAADHYKSEN